MKSVPRRVVVAMLMFFGITVMYALRSNISIAVVEMTSNKTHKLENGTIIHRRDFEWNSEECGVIFSSLYFGPLVSSAVGGWLACRFGGVRVFGLSVLAAGAVTILTPVLNSEKIYPMVILRFSEGMLHAIAYASTGEIWSRWFPPDEQSRLITVSYLGVYIGPAVSYSVSGYVAKLWGWPSIFYVTGSFAVLWWALWSAGVRESPATDPWISEKELRCLEKKIIMPNKVTTYPWIEILFSKATVASYALKFSYAFLYLFFHVMLPVYANDMLHYDITETGFISSLSVLLGMISYMITGVLRDYIQNKKYLTPTHASKVLVFTGVTSSCLILLIAGFSTNNTLVMICVLLFPLFTGIGIGSVISNPVELSPEYSSIITAISATIFTAASIAGPLFVGYIVSSQEASQWRIVICSFSVLILAGMLVFMIFGSSERQNFLKERSIRQ